MYVGMPKFRVVGGAVRCGAVLLSTCARENITLDLHTELCGTKSCPLAISVQSAKTRLFFFSPLSALLFPFPSRTIVLT